MILFDKFKDGKSFACTFSYDDSITQDRRLVALFNKYGIKATFNVITAGLLGKRGNGSLRLEEIAELFRGHEVASHSHDHPHLEKMTPQAQYEQIIRDREILEPVLGYTVRGHAYPYGSYSADTITALKMAGIEYARTVAHETRMPYTIPEEPLTWNPTAHHSEAQKIVDNFLVDVKERGWRAGKVLYIWGHSYEFDNENAKVKWEEFEQMLEKLAEQSGNIWFATNIELIDYAKAQKALRISIDEKFAYNPTDTDVWCTVNGNVVKIPAMTKVDLS